MNQKKLLVEFFVLTSLGVSAAWGQLTNVTGQQQQGAQDPTQVMMNQQFLQSSMRNLMDPVNFAMCANRSMVGNTVNQVANSMNRAFTNRGPQALGGSTLSMSPDGSLNESCAMPSETSTDTNLTCNSFSAGSDTGGAGSFNSGAAESRRQELSLLTQTYECRERQRNLARDQLGCMRDQYQRLQSAMNSTRELVQQQIQMQQRYVQKVDEEVAKQEQVLETLTGDREGNVGREGAGGKLGTLMQNQRALQTLIAEMDRADRDGSPLAQLQNQINRHTHAREAFTHSIAQAKVARTAQCFLTTNQGSAIAPCTINGRLPGSALESILCRYEQQLGGSSRSAAIRNPARARVANLRERLNRLMASVDISRTRGRRIATEGDDNGSGSSLAYDQTTNQAYLQGQFDAILNQAGASGGDIAGHLRTVFQSCTTLANQSVDQDVNTPGSEFRREQNRLNNEATTIRSQANGLIQRFDQPIRDAARELFYQEPGDQLRPDDCTQVMATSNSGQPSFVAQSLQKAQACFHQMRTVAAGMLNGTSMGGSRAVSRIDIPGQQAVQCVGVRDCINQANQIVSRTRTRRTQLQGDATFPDPACSGGQCPGRRKFIREASQALANAVRQSAQAFQMQSNFMQQAMARLNGQLSGLRIPGLRASGRDVANRERWDCPPAGNSGRGGDPQLCSAPENFGEMLAGMVNPPVPRFDDQWGEIESKLNEADSNDSSNKGRVSQALSTINRLLATCPASERSNTASGRLDSLLSRLNRGLTNCSAANPMPLNDCRDNVSGLNRELERIRTEISSSGSNRSRVNEAADLLSQLQVACRESQCGRTRSSDDRTNESRIIGLCGDGESQFASHQLAASARDSSGGSGAPRQVFREGREAWCVHLGDGRGVINPPSNPVSNPAGDSSSGGTRLASGPCRQDGGGGLDCNPPGVRGSAPPTQRGARAPANQSGSGSSGGSTPSRTVPNRSAPTGSVR